MSEAPYMQLYVGDYLADTRHLTTEQHGAYLLLLMGMWAAEGELPNDEAKLARLAGVSLAKWRKIGPDVMAFFSVEGSIVTQKRLKKEREKWEAKSTKRRDAGKRGGQAKALKNQEGHIANATANATNLPEQNATILHIPSPEDDDKSSSWSREDFERAEGLLREAANLQNDPDPTLADISPFMPLLNAGFSLERSILPKLRLIAGRMRRRPGKPWNYYSEAVANSLAEDRERTERMGEVVDINARKEKQNEFLRTLAE